MSTLISKPKPRTMKGGVNMALDLKSLWLTGEECAVVRGRPYISTDYYFGEQMIAEAATAKALWGFLDWIEGEKEMSKVKLYFGLKDALTKAGVQRPEERP